MISRPTRRSIKGWARSVVVARGDPTVNFLAPGFWWALPALAAPFLIHLINRRPPQKKIFESRSLAVGRASQHDAAQTIEKDRFAA